MEAQNPQGMPGIDRGLGGSEGVEKREDGKRGKGEITRAG